MPNYTEKLNLIKPKKSENYDIDDVTNKNMDILDAEITKRVSKVPGKDLSTNDFTNEYKKKVDALFEKSRGMSAYEVYLLSLSDTQNVLTEDEWLKSLNGIHIGNTEPINNEFIWLDLDSMHLKIKNSEGIWINISNIKGDDGTPGINGNTPVKGVDYWTNEEKQEIINTLKAYIDENYTSISTDIDDLLNLVEEI